MIPQGSDLLRPIRDLDPEPVLASDAEIVAAMKHNGVFEGATCSDCAELSQACAEYEVGNAVLEHVNRKLQSDRERLMDRNSMLRAILALACIAIPLAFAWGTRRVKCRK